MNDPTAGWRGFRDAHAQARDGSRRRDAGRGKKKMRAELRAELEREVAKLRNEFLQDRLDAARSTQKIKAVQSSPVSLIA